MGLKLVKGKPQPIEKAPLGMAVALLKGAEIRLENAIESQDETLINSEKNYLLDKIACYEFAVKEAPKDSLVTLTLKRVGKETIWNCYTILETLSLKG